jgi:hypothetical protein
MLSSPRAKFIHSRGLHPCGQTAWWYRLDRLAPLLAGESPLDSAHMAYPGGERAQPGELIICGTCRRSVKPDDLFIDTEEADDGPQD